MSAFGTRVSDVENNTPGLAPKSSNAQMYGPDRVSPLKPQNLLGSYGRKSQDKQ